MNKLYLCLMLVLLSACAGKQTNESVDSVLNSKALESDITAPPAFEKEVESAPIGQTEEGSVSYQKWLEERRQEIKKNQQQ